MRQIPNLEVVITDAASEGAGNACLRHQSGASQAIIMTMSGLGLLSVLML